MDKLKNKARIAKLKMTGLPGWLRRHLVLSIILSIILIFCLGSVVFALTFYRDKAAPGVTIANVKVGGRTKKQIAAIIHNLTKNIRLSLKYDGKSATASAKDLGVDIKTEQLAERAAQTGRNNPLGILFNHQHFDLASSYDKTKVKHFVDANFPELTTDPKDAQLVYNRDQNRYQVQPGTVGKSVRLLDLYRQVEKLLKAPQITSYQITTINDHPTISDKSAEATANKINQSLSQSIQIFNGDRTLWTIDPWTIADWTSFQPNHTTSSYDIAFDKDKITKFITETVAGELSDKPVNQLAITDGNKQVLQVVRPGRNGQTASNVDNITDQIITSLKDGSGKRIEMTTKDSPFQTDAYIAADGHWIEYNRSTYEVRLWAGNGIVWSTNQTSQGKPSTPTITGLFRVWYKVYQQCMPNPPAKEPLCNIHYITFWQSSGYAFHEAWWMNYANGNVRQGISHGCVNMFIGDAKRVYDWASIGTPVWVHN